MTQITTKIWANGKRRIDVFSVVTGPAADSHGGTYVFVYENHAIYNVPADGPVKVRVKMFDSFRVIGNGFSMAIGFEWRWKFPVTSGSAFDPGPEFTGVVFPNDPVNPTNVFDFKALSTQGDPGHCDPL